jgi:hypothetical protein
VNDDVVFVRAVTEMTQPVTNRYRATLSSLYIEVVTIEPVFQSAFEGNVLDGGALVIWRAGTNGAGNLIVIAPQVHAPGAPAIPAGTGPIVPATTVWVTPR